MSGKAEDRKPFVFLKTPFREAYGTFSPDGRWVAYHSNESGRPEIYVRPFIPPSRDASADKPAGTKPARLHRRPEASGRSPPPVESTPCGGPTAKSCTTSTRTAR